MFNIDMKEWELVDEARRKQRLSELAFRTSVYEAMLRWEKLEHWRPKKNQNSYHFMGGYVGRGMLISWIFEECRNQELQPSTACLAVNYFDRVISLSHVDMNMGRQVAVVCLLLGTKMNEVGGDGMNIPVFPNFVPNKELEMMTLKMLEWNLVVPTPYTFLSIYGEKLWLPQFSRERAFQYLQHMTLCT